MKEAKQQLVVSAIQNGTVIDHVPAGSLFKVIQILRLDHIENQITFGTNLESKKLGRKAIIKISGRFFEDDDINRIALVAPEAKLNIIRDYEVVEKRVVVVPDTIVGIGAGMALSKLNSKKPILVMCEVPEDTSLTKISMRTNERVVERGIDLQRALSDASAEYGGGGGGHKIAAGAYIPKSAEQEFLDRVNRILGEQFVAAGTDNR